jgi:hypothetical protein
MIFSKRFALRSAATLRLFIRELQIGTLMGEIQVSPRLLGHNIVDGPRGPIGILDFEKIERSFSDPVDFLSDLKQADSSLGEFVDKVTEKIHRMHSMGFAHGDLHIGNIVYRFPEQGGIEVFLIDFEHSYSIRDGLHDPDLVAWMKSFPWESTYESFVQFDLKLWKTQLYGLIGPHLLC